MPHHGYAEFPQLVLGTNAREQQQMGRSDSAGAQHHAAAVDPEHLAAAFGFDADSLAVLDHDLADKDPASHRQVEIVAHRIEMRQGGAHPHAIDIVQQRRSETGRVQAVLVRWVVIEDGKAVGVEAESGGKVFRIDGGRVVLSAGGCQIAPHGDTVGRGSRGPVAGNSAVPVVRHLPGVGSNP